MNTLDRKSFLRLPQSVKSKFLSVFVGLLGLLASLPAHAVRVTTAVPPHLATLYPHAGYAGTPVQFDQLGTWASGSKNWAAIAACNNGSLRLAPGYRLRLLVNSSSHELFKPEDDLDLSDDSITSLKQVVVEPAPPPPLRSRVLLVIHGSTLLADNANDLLWTNVQQNVDGIWFNAAGVSWPNISNIVSKVRHPVLINEQDSQVAGLEAWKPLPNLQPNTLLSKYPKISCTFEATSLYRGYANGDAVTIWNPGEVNWARSNYSDAVPPPPTRIFPKIYTGWQPFPFWQKPKDAGHSLIGGTVAAQEFLADDGAFMECDPGLFLFIKAHRYAVTNCAIQCHAAGKPFLWFMSHFKRGEAVNEPDPNYVQKVKNAYYAMEAYGLIATNDAFFVVNYQGSMQVLPESDPSGHTPPTYTGILNWLLQQGPEPPPALPPSSKPTPPPR